MRIDVDAIFTTNTVLFSLVIWALIETMRRVVDALLTRRGWETNHYWRGVVLPTLPVVVGVVLALSIKGIPHPDGWESTGARILYGLVCGFFAGDVYRVVKGIVKKQWESVSTSDTSSPPPSTAG